MSKIFIAIFAFFQHRKTLLVLLLAIISALLVFSMSRISFMEDISSFLPNNAENKRINDAYQKMGSANTIIVTFSQKDTTKTIDENLLTDAATHFSEILRKSDTEGHIKDLLCEIDAEKMNEVTQFITQNLPYFLNESDYCRMDSLLTPQSITRNLKADKELLLSPMGSFVRNVIVNDPLHFSQNVLKTLENFKQDEHYHTESGFIFNDRNECIVTITSNYPISETAYNKQLSEEIYDAVNQTQTAFHNDIRILPFGASLISITNAEQIKKDSLMALSIALILILALLYYFFRNFKNLFFIAVSVIFGALFSLGVIALFKSTVSVIAIGMASIILGIAINYPLHFLAHFRHVRNVQQTIKDIVNPLLIGNVTTVGAFLSLLFISSSAMKDLGLFSSFLLVGTIGFVLVVLPQFLFLRPLKNQVIPINHGFGKLAEFSPEKNKCLVFVFLIFTVVLFVFSFGTKFETNLHAINYMTDEQRVEMNKWIAQNKDKEQTAYVVAEGKTIEESLQNYETFILPNLSNFSRISGISTFFPSKKMQEQKLERWTDFWKNKKENFIQDFNKIANDQGFNAHVFDRFTTLLNTNFQPENFEYFAPLYNHIGENYFSIRANQTLVYTMVEGETCTIPADSSVFVFNDTSIAQKMVDALSDDFNNVLYICGFVVFIFLLFSFGRIELAILTFIPLTVGWIWILGFMNILDLKFNIVNIILATFIFGQGDDYTIFVTEGLMHEYTYRKKMLASFKNSIILSASILFIAIGTLIFAKHPAMRSLAELTIVGMISVVMCAYLFPPLIFRWLTLRKGKLRLMPITFVNLFSSIYVFLVFLLGSLIITVAGFCMFTIGKTTDRKKLRYHRLMYGVSRFVVVHIPHVKTAYNTFDPTIFDKPAIMICNHQSHIDLMCVMSLTPKLIILTNDWVWNSPFYGRLIKYADFYPVSNGVEQALENLQAMVDKGYSIMVFPEGTRSETCDIQRFHRGAFYLAEHLKLDILPVLIHGVGHFLPKKEFMLRKGEIHINVMPRMDCNSMGETFAERAKQMRRYYKNEYEKLASEVETADYYSNLVLHNYIYKGAAVERAVRRNLKRFHNYREIVPQLKHHHRLLVVNCGYGEFPLLLSLVHKHLDIVATDSDADKLALAANCAWVKEHLNYVEHVRSDENFDAVVLINPTNEQCEMWAKTEIKHYILKN